MRELVFSDAHAKKTLEDLLHPMIRVEVEAQMNAIADPAATRMRAPYAVIVVPLLIETGAYRNLARRILVVDCDEREQIARVIRRSGLTSVAVQAIMANQVGRADRLRHADDIVHNDGDLAALRAAVEALHRKYVELARMPAGLA